MHNLPCEKEKELLQELKIVRHNYSKEKEMREQLELNISDIVMNFKRLYDEADTARLIVTKKLKEISEKEKHLNITPVPFSNPPFVKEERTTPKNNSMSNTEDRIKGSVKTG